MTAAGGQLRAVVFGDLDGGVWGAALGADEPAVVLGDRAGATLTRGPGDATWASDGRGWKLAGEGLDLQVEPGGEDPAEAAADGVDRLTGFQELCRVRGAVSVGGSARRLDCIGTRCAIAGVAPGSLGSARVVSGWFGGDDAFMLMALRPAGATAQADDLVAATLFDPEGWVAVSDPRLSTTYARSREPTRANLELWVGNGESEYPRRASGEASGPAVSLTVARLSLRLTPLHCHSRGHEGAGAYLLADF